MTVTSPASAPDTHQGPASDERLLGTSPLKRLLSRPELGSVVGALAVLGFFSLAAESFLRASSLSTVLYAASTIGIMAVPVALLMIGGEFDLSAGVLVTTSALASSIFSYRMTANVWVGVGVSLLFTLAIGAFNGLVLARTKLPSFIVTLGTFLMLAGLNLGCTKLFSETVSTKSISDMDGFSSARAVFASTVTIGGVAFKITILWWIVLVALASWVLLRTRAGNWIFAVGGNKDASRAVGVPVGRTKTGLYMGVALGAWISGQHLLFSYDVVQSGEGVGNELIYIIAAVIGGCLITGGYGSAVGSAVGALIFGMTSKGIVFAQWNPDWFKFFLGAMLLLATCSTPGSASARRPRHDGRHGAHRARPPRGHRQALRQRPRPRRGLPGGPRGRDHLRTRRQRRGQVDPHQDRRRASPARRRNLPHRGGGERPVLPREALDRGIATVHQDLAVVPLMPVWRNFFLGSERARASAPSSAWTSTSCGARRVSSSCAWASTCATSTSPSAPCRVVNASAWPSHGRCISGPRC